MMMTAAQELPEFDGHEAIVPVEDTNTGLRGFIAIHRRFGEQPSFGATRLWPYGAAADALRDALRLSRLMSYKAAFAGLSFGGAKAVLIDDALVGEKRVKLFAQYGVAVEGLAGQFITGTDAGVHRTDLQAMASSTKYITGFTVDPGRWTALGVYYAIEVTLERLFASPVLEGHTFAIQGLGKVGIELLRLLHHRAQMIVVSDVDHEKVARLRMEFPNIYEADAREVHRAPVDVFCPCAPAASLTVTQALEMRSRAIVGAANNQLADLHVAEVLASRSILYAPDYIVNAGGLISVAAEWQREIINDEVLADRIYRIAETLQDVYQKSEQAACAPAIMAENIGGALLQMRTATA